MTNDTPNSIAAHFRWMRDPRSKAKRKYPLIDIITVALCGVLAGCKTFKAIELWAKDRIHWFQDSIKIESGIPSGDTIARVFSLLNPTQFQSRLMDWLKSLNKVEGIKHIAIDGKTLCGSDGDGFAKLHVVSAWATEQRLSLGQTAVESKSNEITAIPELLSLLQLKGAIVTIDAMGCQRKIAEQIDEQGGTYVLTVKGNQPNLYNAVIDQIQHVLEFEEESKTEEGQPIVTYHETVEKGHGREEDRLYVSVLVDETFEPTKNWVNLATIGVCISERIINGVATDELRFWISNGKLSAMEAGQVLRGHWGIENSLHWQLDVTFREDDNQVCERTRGANLAALRRVAVSLLSRHPAKLSLQNKQIRASGNPHFLAQLLMPPSR